MPDRKSLENVKRIRASVTREIQAALTLLILAASLTGCVAHTTYDSSNGSSRSHPSSSSSISARDERSSYGDLRTSFPTLYKYSDKTVKENVYNESRVVSYLDAVNYVGQEVTVEGSVTSVYHAIQSTGKPYFLNFGDNAFCAVIWEENQESTELTELDSLTTWTDEYGSIDLPMRVSGLVEMYKGEPQIVVRDATQLAADIGTEGSPTWMNYLSIDKMLEYEGITPY